MHNERRKRLKWTVLYKPCLVAQGLLLYQKKCGDDLVKVTPYFFKFTSLELSHQHFEKASFCSGGDNNPGLLVLPNEKKEHQFAVNDSIIGRPSQGFIAKVHNQTESLRTTQQFFQIFEVAFNLPNKKTCNYLEKRL